MAISFEASLHVPLVLVLLASAIVSFPRIYVDIHKLTEEYYGSRGNSNGIYSVFNGERIKTINVNPQELINIIMWTDDQIINLNEYLKGEIDHD